ncbi:MAG: hypothetical protein MUP98_19450 [Candidatus Aminicenantes bacterium]|nr:hypothetical protein [Candidatus Aminicenantes bacterium]
MAYEFKNSKGVTYYLHFKDVNLKGGRQQRIYFFARDVRDGSLDAVPNGYIAVETERTGMPILKKG